MFKKLFATLAVGVLAALAVPTAAQAYAPGVNITIIGNIGPGATVTIIVADNVFIGGEQVNFLVEGVGQSTLASSARTSTSLVKTANAEGGASASLTIPTNARGTYTVSATGLQSGTPVETEFTIVADGSTGSGSGTGAGSSNDGLAATGINGVPMLAIWTASGLALLGAALIAVMTIVRRQRANG